jgi:hypothetical protein
MVQNTFSGLPHKIDSLLSFISGLEDYGMHLLITQIQRDVLVEKQLSIQVARTSA